MKEIFLMATGYKQKWRKIHLGRTKLATDWCGDISMVYSSIDIGSVFITFNKIKLRYKFNW